MIGVCKKTKPDIAVVASGQEAQPRSKSDCQPCTPNSDPQLTMTARSSTQGQKRYSFFPLIDFSSDDDAPVLPKKARRRDTSFFNENQSNTEPRKRAPKNAKEIQELRELDLKVFKEIIGSILLLKKRDGTLVYDWFEGAMLARCEFWKRFC